MNFKLYKASKENFRLSLKLAMAICFFLVLLNSFLVVMYMKATSKTNYIIVPPGINSPVYIGDEYIDRKYLLAMGVYVANLLMTYSYENIEENINRLILLAAPESKGIIEQKLKQDIEFIKSKKIVQTFQINSINVYYYKNKKDILKQMQGIVVSPIKGEIEIVGSLARRIGTSAPIWKGDVRLKIRYIVRNGMFQVVGFKINLAIPKVKK